MNKITTKWFEELPEQCPPKDAKECNGIYYRIANGNPATSADFFSQKRLQPDKIFTGEGIDDCIVKSIREKIEITQIQKRGNCRSKVGAQRRNDKEDLW